MSRPRQSLFAGLIILGAAAGLYGAGRHNGKTAEAARWQAEIGRQNAETAKKLDETRAQARRAESAALEKQLALENELRELEAENEGNDKERGDGCRLGGGAVRLLNRQADD